MPFAPHRMRDAFEAQGELGFTVWSCATDDSLEQLLRPGCFAALRIAFCRAT